MPTANDLSGPGPERRPGRIVPIPVEQPRMRRSDHVLAQLLQAIRDLTLTPGESLSETDLAEQLHVSRTPLREAIARLADIGLVVVVPQVGTRVALISMGEVVQAQFVRETLEVGAFAAACTKGPHDLTELRAIIAQQHIAWQAADFNEFFLLDEALHQAIFAVSGYPGAWTAVQGMKVQLDRLRRLMPDAATLGELIAEHTAIVDALEARESATGQALIADHARRVLQYAPSLREQFPDYFAD